MDNAFALPKPELGMITTQWVMVTDSIHFVKRYGRAIQRYLRALLKNKYDAEEVAQEFFLSVSKHGFSNANPEKGRFRDYLKVAVRNAALNFLRKNENNQKLARGLAELRDHHRRNAIPDKEWILEWRECLLNRAWQEMEKTQNHEPEAIYYTVLRLAVAHPSEDSETLAARAGTILGRSIRADAFRKQLSRARRLFAEYLVEEIAQTLETPSAEAVEEELADLGLFTSVRRFLPSDWHSRMLTRIPHRG